MFFVFSRGLKQMEAWVPFETRPDPPSSEPAPKGRWRAERPSQSLPRQRLWRRPCHGSGRNPELAVSLLRLLVFALSSALLFLGGGGQPHIIYIYIYIVIYCKRFASPASASPLLAGFKAYAVL